jgi:predicted ATPase
MTALTGIYLRNFQSIKDPVFLQLDKLCFLYGPNSAGKSSVLDALDLVKKTITGQTDGYRLDYFYRKHQNINWDLGVGVEVISPMSNEFSRGENKNAEEWWETPDQRGDFFHQEFFSKIKGKKFQVEFGGQGSGIKVAIEGKPLFEFDEQCIDYNDFYKKISDDEEDSDEYLSGRLIIFKNNKLNEIYDQEYLDFFPTKGKAYLPLSSYFRELFVEEDDEKLIIHGLHFDAGKEFQTNIVNVSYSVEDIIFPRYESLKQHRADDIEYQNFIEEHFSESTEEGKEAAQRRKIIYWTLEKVARDFEKLLKGFFYEIQYALQYSHVRGDRQLLNSAACFSYPRHSNVDPKNCSLDEYDPMARYARFIADKSGSLQLPTPSIKNDFINKSLKDYLISLRGYEIYPETLELTKMGSEDLAAKFIFLKVKHKELDNLGFQDVGSGISYVFPILSSLWASNLSFIEQPELHLHPSAQCELGDVFIAAYNKGSIAVVESHSEHMLLRILRRIRETTNDYLLPKEMKFTANDLRIYYFKPEPNGFTSVKEIRVDGYGELLNSWPGGFFSERDRELFGE